MATPSDIWNDILKGDVKKDDPLWKEYLDKAAVFDARMLDELNKIVDVLLVYVALFIATLTSFIIQANTQLKRDPADITNDLLKAMYIQMIAQSNNTSIPPADPSIFFQQSDDDHYDAVFQNGLLYASLSLCIIVSVISLAAKLWLVSYNHQAFSDGSPYGRAMKRQEAYNGVLVWNLGGVINALPLILLLALFLFEIYVYTSISAQDIIGLIVVILFNAGLSFLGLTSLGGAFLPGCPFRSAFSSVIRHIFKILLLVQRIMHGCRRLPSKLVRGLWIAIPIMALTALIMTNMTSFASLIFLAMTSIPLAYFAYWHPDSEVSHTPQKYKISHLALWGFLPISVVMTVPSWFAGIQPDISSEVVFIFTTISYISGIPLMFSAMFLYSNMSKSMADTGEIDAIAWLLKTAPPSNSAEFFKKAGQMTVSKSIGSHYRPRLLKSLMPFLSLLITSHHLPKHPSSESDTHSPSSNDEDPHSKPELENIEIYTACLARLSDFLDREGSFKRLWEDTMQHPELEPPLVDKLVQFANLDPRHRLHDRLRIAATNVLKNYKLDMEGKPVTLIVPPTLDSERSRGVATVLRNAAFLMLTVSGLNNQKEPGHQNLCEPVELELGTHVEPPHSSGDIEEA